MLRALLLFLAVLIGAAAAYAQSAAIQQRKALFKAMDTSAEGVAAMFQGSAPFDLAKVQATLRLIQETTKKLPTLFPDDSKTGDTAALPVIWEKKADFTDRFAKISAAAAAAELAVKDQATMKGELPKLFDMCTACHRPYRKRRG